MNISEYTCPSYFSIFVKRHCDPGNFWKKDFIGAYGFREWVYGPQCRHNGCRPAGIGAYSCHTYSSGVCVTSPKAWPKSWVKSFMETGLLESLASHNTDVVQICPWDSLVKGLDCFLSVLFYYKCLQGMIWQIAKLDWTLLPGLHWCPNILGNCWADLGLRIS